MQSHTLLFIEDDSGVREVYSRALRHYGYEVLEADDGAEGLRLAREAQPDLILVDLVLPEMDGWQVTHALKHDPGTARIPVVAFTVHAHDFYRARAEAAGCDLFLGKPRSPRRLRESIEQLLGACGTEPGSG